MQNMPLVLGIDQAHKKQILDLYIMGHKTRQKISEWNVLDLLDQIIQEIPSSLTNADVILSF